MGTLFADCYTLEITCADPAYFMDRFAGCGIVIKHINFVDCLTFRIQISGKYYCIVTDLVEQLGGRVEVINLTGPSVLLRLFRKRIILFSGVICIMLLTLYLPGRILFISVEGNKQLEAQYILEQAEYVGISFGAARKNVRSEKMKNALLQAAPELKWAGINTYGCRAVISVIERDSNALKQLEATGVQGIYATRDGIVSSLTVTKGTALCKTGQAIHVGQLLISGYTDCGRFTRAESAEGEVCAVTQRKITGIVAPFSENRGKIKGVKRKWSIQFGKKRIKLYIGSGNSTGCCGKIYETFDLTLPGGFHLPISAVRETITMYENSDTQRFPDENVIQDLARDYIVGDMVAGRIINMHASIETSEDIYVLTGAAICEEVIGRLQNEEI